MSLWQQLLRLLGYHKTTDRFTFEADASLIHSLQGLAKQQRRPEHEVAAELLSFAIAQRDAAEQNLQRWEQLSPREQQVAALICLGYTNRQIAARLTISPETVKTHARNLLLKFGLGSREELRFALAGWDFSAWDR
ncbi:MAG: helix-turn-helix transcriptional regulator [Anaerolineales bacterium]|nr:MAG: helix-turn-helix transcriptional regulator [Anaerolineales bacterium]